MNIKKSFSLSLLFCFFFISVVFASYDPNVNPSTYPHNPNPTTIKKPSYDIDIYDHTSKYTPSFRGTDPDTFGEVSWSTTIGDKNGRFILLEPTEDDLKSWGKYNFKKYELVDDQMKSLYPEFISIYYLFYDDQLALIEAKTEGVTNSRKIVSIFLKWYGARKTDDINEYMSYKNKKSGAFGSYSPTTKIGTFYIINNNKELNKKMDKALKS